MPVFHTKTIESILEPVAQQVKALPLFQCLRISNVSSFMVYDQVVASVRYTSYLKYLCAYCRFEYCVLACVAKFKLSNIFL